jgi:hypothetical protein
VGETQCRAAEHCSIKCHHEHDFRLRVALLERGLYPASLYSPFLKRYLLWKRGEHCSRCGWAERHPVTGKVPVELEHIDGNWENNAFENITLLCPNCHSLTPTFRALNRGHGRAERLGGRENPMRRGVAKYQKLRSAVAPFPLPRSLVEAVEAKDAAVAADVAEWLKARDL